MKYLRILAFIIVCGMPALAQSVPLYEGYVGVDCQSIWGWAADRTRPNQSVRVNIYDGSTLITQMMAIDPRPDITSYLNDGGLHGFVLARPAQISDGKQHALRVTFDNGTSLIGAVGQVCGSCTAPAGAIDIKSFGAKGDGVSDDFPAILAASKAIKSGQTLFFPSGTYRINRFAYSKDGGATYRDSTTNLDLTPLWGEGQKIQWRSLQNVKILGCGAVIDIKGDFLVGDDGQGTIRSPIIPFDIQNSTNITIDGFEVNGHSEQSTGAANQYPCVGYGLMSRKNNGITISNFKAHHNTCDGMVFGHSSGADFNVVVSNADLHHNGRDGVSIVHMVGGLFTNSLFHENGIPGGNFPGLSPKAGMDIEPEDVTQPAVDNIVFDTCSFTGNAAFAWDITSYNEKQPYPQVRNVTFKGCTVQGNTFVNPIAGAIIHNQ
jgi:hypothetical protein